MVRIRQSLKIRSFYGLACILEDRTFLKTQLANQIDGNSYVVLFAYTANLTMIEQTKDSLWALVFSSGGTTWTILSCGNYSESMQNTGAGVFKMKMSFDAVTSGCQVSAEMRRGDATVLDFKPAGFVFDRNPKTYNFNALVAGSQPQSSISGADSLVISGRFICLWAFAFALFMSQ